MLTDKEATLDNIRTKLFEVATSVNEGDRLLVYYAGHGETYDLKSGGERGYLIPVDGDLDNIFATCLPMSDIKEIANVTEAKHVLFLMDACYGGLLAVDARSIRKTTPGYIDKITRDNARQIITAGGKGEQVIEKSEWGHSAFTKNLLSGLRDWMADTWRATGRNTCPSWFLFIDSYHGGFDERRMLHHHPVEWTPEGEAAIAPSPGIKNFNEDKWHVYQKAGDRTFTVTRWVHGLCP